MTDERQSEALGALAHRMRPSDGEPQGLLVLHHGRATSENDLFPLLDVLDPDRRLIGVTPRGPLSLPPGGAHWYVVREVGYPDAATFGPTFATLAAWHDALRAATGIGPERTVVGGFSQGTVMSYALGLGAGLPRPAGILAMSGFVPTVDGWSLDLDRPLPRIAIGHGSADPVISVDFARAARDRLEAAGADLLYREYPLAHSVDPGFLSEAASWLAATIPS